MSLSDDDTYAATSLFSDTDYLMSLQLTILHKIVLNLIPKSLKTELEHCTSQIDDRDSRGRTCLFWAAARGDVKNLEILLDYQAKVDLCDEHGDTALHHAKNEDCIKLLLAAKLPVDVRNHSGATSLMLACRLYNTPATALALLNYGADVNAVDKSHQTPLHGAADHGRRSRCIEPLVRNGADVNTANSTSDSPLRLAILFNAHDGLRHMLHSDKSSADFTTRNCFGHTFAHTIAHYADVETVNILTKTVPLGLTADVTSRDAGGMTSLEHFEGRFDVDDQLRTALYRLFQVLRGRLSDVSQVSNVSEAQTLQNTDIEEDNDVFYDAFAAV